MQILRLPIHTSRLTINHFPFISKVSDFSNHQQQKLELSPNAIDPSSSTHLRSFRTQITPPKADRQHHPASTADARPRTPIEESPSPPHLPPRAIESRGVATTDAADDDGGEKKHPPVRAETERDREREGAGGGPRSVRGADPTVGTRSLPHEDPEEIPPGGDLFPLFGGGPAGGLGRRLAPTRRPATQISLALLRSAATA